MAALQSSLGAHGGIAANLPRILHLHDQSDLLLEHILSDTKSSECEIPGETCTIYTGHKITSDGHSTGNDLVVKIRHQPSKLGDSWSVSAACSREVNALRQFAEEKLDCAPHLVGLCCNEPTNAGRDVVLSMTKVPGENLLEGKYWSLGFEERQEIQEQLLKALRRDTT